MSGWRSESLSALTNVFLVIPGLPLIIVIATMVETGRMTWADVARTMSTAPARIGRVASQGRGLEVGSPANITLVDPSVRQTVDPRAQWSRSSNTPYAGLELPGRVCHTIHLGERTVVEGVPVALRSSAFVTRAPGAT